MPPTTSPGLKVSTNSVFWSSRTQYLFSSLGVLFIQAGPVLSLLTLLA